MDDDDFDFGGFEAAEPVAPSQAGPAIIPGIQASPSPWAVFPGVASQPDVIQTQKPPQPRPEPPFPQEEYNATLAQPVTAEKGNKPQDSTELSSGNDTGTRAGFKDPFAETATQNGKAADSMFDTDFDQMFPASPSKSKSSTASKPTPNAVKDPLKVKAVAPDVTSGSNSGTKSPGSSSLPEAESNMLLEDDLDLKDMVALESKKSQSVPNTGAIPKSTSTVAKPAMVNSEHPKQIEELEKKLTKAQEEKQQLQKDLSDTVSRNRSLETELSNSVKKLSEQMQTYEQLQSKHKDELSEIRKSSNSALALIVEEYKELVKTAVLEQQKSSEKQIKEILEREAEKQEKKIQEQHEKFGQLLDEERSSLKEKMEEQLQKQVTKQQEELAEMMEKERNSISKQIQEALKEERLVSEKAVSAAVEAEKSQSSQHLKQQQEEFQKAMEEQEKKSREMMKSAILEEKDKSHELVRKAILEEQSKSRELLEEVVTKSREETKKYLQEQKQAESSLRKKSLASVELFLESAKKQIEFLLEDSSANQELEPS